MARIHFTRNLNRFFPTLASIEVQASTVAEVVAAVEGKFPGLAAYIVDETGGLRQHVNIFVDGRGVEDRVKLSDGVVAKSEVHIIQALSGG